MPRAMKFNFGDFLMLRVLTLQGIRGSPHLVDDGFRQILGLFIENLKLPSSIGKLIHLRYLSLRDSRFLIVSASSLSNLKQLQTLDLRLNHIYRITSIQTLQLLKHLYLPEADNLGHFCEFIKMRKLRFDGLNNLELLEGFNNTFCETKSLSTLTNLQTLTSSVIDNLEDLGEFLNAVINLTNLRSLRLHVQVKELLPLDMVREMFSWGSLTYLNLNGSLIKELPEYKVGFGQNIHSLQLGYCRIDKDPLTTLEKLPNLRILCLGDQSYGEKELTCHALGFPKLSYLKLGDLENLEKWEIEEGAMPLLSHLELRRCRQLKMIPEGLKSITSLKKLDIKYMPEEFRERLKVNGGVEGEDLFKVRHVDSVSII